MHPVNMCNITYLFRYLDKTPVYMSSMRSWIRNPANYSSMANTNETHATKKFGAVYTLMNLGNSAKA
jgi:hypothetical protein